MMPIRIVGKYVWSVWKLWRGVWNYSTLSALKFSSCVIDKNCGYYKSILYSFSLLYKVFRSISNNCAALLLLFPV